MFIDKISKNARKIIVASLVGLTILFGSVFAFQHRTINDLKKDLYIQTQMTEQK